MSLVCYGSSDEESEEEMAIPEAEDQNILQTQGRKGPNFEKQNVKKDEEILNFDSIPKPIPKKGRETVKITIPSLDQFKDEDIKIESKAKPIYKGGSGLLCMLPPPKNSGSTTQRGLTPHVLTKQKSTAKKIPGIKSVPKKSSSQSIKPASISKAEHSSESISTHNDEEDDSTSVDFFSLESVNKKVEVEENSVLDAQLPSKSVLFSSLPKPAQSTTHTVTPLYQEATSTSNSGPFTSYSSSQSENSSQYYGWNENYPGAHSSDQDGWSENYQSVDQTDAEMQILKDEQFKKMLGRKNENIQIIDVNADDQLIGKEQWLMQSLTEEKTHRPSKRRGEMPTQQQKRKHQITYLAFQAKERELDLKNQWSLNNRTRRETQAKYGF